MGESLDEGARWEHLNGRTLVARLLAAFIATALELIPCRAESACDVGRHWWCGRVRDGRRWLESVEVQHGIPTGLSQCGYSGAETAELRL